MDALDALQLTHRSSLKKKDGGGANEDDPMRDYLDKI